MREEEREMARTELINFVEQHYPHLFSNSNWVQQPYVDDIVRFPLNWAAWRNPLRPIHHIKKHSL